MDMLFAMRVFQRVAATQSFTETGERMGLATSSVARHVDALEQSLGVKLLTRSTRKLSMTEAGRRYKGRVDGLLAELDALHEEIAEDSDALRGRLKVSTPRVFGKRLIAPLVPAFLTAHPKMTVELVLTDDYVDLVDTDTDLAIRIGALGDSSLVSRPLGRYRRVVCCHPSYLEGREAPRVPADLANHRCLRYRRAGERVVWRFGGVNGGGEIEHVEPRGDFVANDVEVLLTAVSAGAGIAVLPHWLVHDAFARGDLVQLLADHPIASSLEAAGIHFVYALNRRNSRKLHAFMAFVSARTEALLV
jgi:DNA-binding transcriptional LysR family regulator